MSTSLGIKPGLEVITRLLELMGNPHRGLKYVHIAGTNGKGSTSLMVSNMLIDAGYRVGRFNSPHLHSYLERITINNQQMDATQLSNYLDQTEENICTMLKEGFRHPTEFEILTAVAFKFFQDRQVDIAVLETGMGGVYDSTNVIIPRVAVITGIALDHVNFLGDSLEEIAWNKAGIIKEHVPVVIGNMPDRAAMVINQTARAKKAPVKRSAAVKIKKIAGTALKGQTISITSDFLSIPAARFSLLGDYQLENLSTALAAIGLLQPEFEVKSRNIINTLNNLTMPGRMEILRDEPLIIGDVGHNSQAARALTQSLHNLLPHRQKILVCGLVDDKDVSAIVPYWGQDTRVCIVTRPEGHRNNNWQRVKKEWQKVFPNVMVFAEEDIKAAVDRGIKLLKTNEYMVVTGSFYVLNQARKYLINS
ncbi:MAG: bifunctional folylpolyglutamate synthase/dihydrofolate synthase [Syntrophomonadaceae bacterium]